MKCLDAFDMLPITLVYMDIYVRNDHFDMYMYPFHKDPGIHSNPFRNTSNQAIHPVLKINK